MLSEICYAKINLFLEVLDKREDNFHNIDTVMQTVTLCDRVTVTENNEAVIRISSNCDILPSDENNICHKAATEYARYFGIDRLGIDIYIEKNIPIAAGLAGGSSNAAGVLRALNKLYKRADLCALEFIASRVGSDVPFLIEGGCVRASDTGTVMTDINTVPNCYFVLAKGEKGINTGEAYTELDSIVSEYRNSNAMVTAINEQNIENICHNLYNAFEKVILSKNEEATVIRNLLASNGAKGVLMSGSGPSVFGIFDSLTQARQAAYKLEKIGFSAFVCEPVKKINI